MTRRTVYVGAAIVALAAAGFIAYRFDPAGGAFPYPRCMFKVLTGWDCPGCGSTRALHALLHGRVADALAANPAIFVALPLIALCLAAESPRCPKLRRIITSPAAACTLIAAALLWTLFRNLLLP